MGFTVHCTYVHYCTVHQSTLYQSTQYARTSTYLLRVEGGALHMCTQTYLCKVLIAGTYPDHAPAEFIIAARGL